MEDSPAKTPRWEVSLTLAGASSESEAFSRDAESVYRSSKALRGDLDLFDRARKALDIQIEKTRLAFEEYITALDRIVSSPLIKRASDVDPEDVLSSLRSPSIFRLPKITSSSLSASLSKSLKEHKEKYKVFRGVLSVISASRAKRDAGGEEVRPDKSETHEMKVSLIDSQVEFALSTGKLSLELVLGTFREIKALMKMCRSHSEDCLLSEGLAPEMNVSAQMAESAEEELRTADTCGQEEREMIIREINLGHVPGSSLEEREASKFDKGFLSSRGRESPLHTFFSVFSVNKTRYRGEVRLFEDRMFLSDSLFGWCFLVYKSEVFFSRTRKDSFELESVNDHVLFTCEKEGVERLSQWLRGPIAREHVEAVGQCGSSVQDVFNGLFGDNDPVGSRSRAKSGVVIVEESPWVGLVKRRTLSLPGSWSFLWKRFLYKEKLIKREGPSRMEVEIWGVFKNTGAPFFLEFRAREVMYSAEGATKCAITLEKVGGSLPFLPRILSPWIIRVLERMTLDTIEEMGGSMVPRTRDRSLLLNRVGMLFLFLAVLLQERKVFF
jgi:hypothetical protein